MQARLLLEDGTEFFGRYFTEVSDVFGEVVFNTAMSGYQEVVTDPSYSNQCVVMTYPMIGNYGINDDDVESKKIYLNALLCKEYVDHPSNWQSVKSLKTYLEEHGKVGVDRLDTRALTLHVRDHGAQRMMITSDVDSSVDELLKKIQAVPKMAGLNLAQQVTTESSYSWNDQRANDKKFKLAVLDCGVKYNILRHLDERGCDCVVMPIDQAKDMLENDTYHGLFISNGPGDPEPVQAAVDVIKSQLGKLPIFGICLGHQLIAHALGAKTYKLKFGHHGINHPVKNLQTGKVEITSQNHGFCVDVSSLGSDVTVTHVNLYDGTNEGFRHNAYPLFSVQYHPEAAPGPCDSDYLFDEFVQMMETTHVHA
ncbi:carbamoyl phosphate synthase small subunit [Candidatus Marinamargulisbacteria bacterium SCGC AG-343-K17]|nr:carbamoyl phosphate synthase small subunit [Candidatus Marinamargulisbacteria bacterium SCGC AG-343-K17]